MKIPRELITQPFEGAVEDLKFDEEPAGLWNFVEGENNFVGENQRLDIQQFFFFFLGGWSPCELD